MSDNIRHLPIARADTTKRQLRMITRTPGECHHRGVTYYFDEAENEITCGACKARLNPVWVIAEMAKHESRWCAHREAYLRALEKYEQRKRCKCEHCGQFTRIRGL